MAENLDDFDAVLERVRTTAQARVNSGELGDIDNMTIKELRMKAVNEADRLLTQDSAASIASVIVWVVVT
jgi:hypothetical protein